MSSSLNNNNNNNNSSRPNSFNSLQQQQQQLFNNNVILQQHQQQTTSRPYHLLNLATIQQKPQPTNYYPFRVASTPRTPYQPSPPPATVLYPFDNNNLFDLKNNPSTPLHQNIDNNTQSLPLDIKRRSSSLNSLNYFELRPPSVPAPKLPSLNPSDDLIDLNDVSFVSTSSTVVAVDNDISLFDPLFVPPPPPPPIIIKDVQPAVSAITSNEKTVQNTKIPTPPAKPRSNSNKQISTPVEYVQKMITRQVSVLEKIEKFQFIEKSLGETISEINTFEVFINDLKKQINSTSDNNSSSNLSNSVIVYSSLLEQPILNDIDIKLTIRRYDSLTSKTKQIFLNVSINCTIETFLYEILDKFELKDLNVNNYLLKIHGKEEYLPIKEILGELKHIQECLCLNKDPIFILIEIKNINKQLSLNKVTGEKENLFKFEIDSQTSLRNKLETLLKNIFLNKEQIDNSVQNSDQISALENFCHNFKTHLRELIKLVYRINYTSLIDLVDQLDSIELDLKSYHSKSALGELSKKLFTISNNVIIACVKFCNLASKSFEWPFRLKSNDDNGGIVTEKREIIQATEKLTVFVENINNLANFLTTLNLQLK
jgi:hypothetical protein